MKMDRDRSLACDMSLQLFFARTTLPSRTAMFKEGRSLEYIFTGGGREPPGNRFAMSGAWPWDCSGPSATHISRIKPAATLSLAIIVGDWSRERERESSFWFCVLWEVLSKVSSASLLYAYPQLQWHWQLELYWTNWRNSSDGLAMWQPMLSR